MSVNEYDFRVGRGITAVYFPRRKDPKAFRLSYDGKFGRQGGDWNKEKQWLGLQKEKKLIKNYGANLLKIKQEKVHVITGCEQQEGVKGLHQRPNKYRIYNKMMQVGEN